MVLRTSADIFVQEPVHVTHDYRLHLWRIKSEGARITARRGVPLTHGTAPARWRESWTCGKVEPHTWRECPNEALPSEERIFRAEEAKCRMALSI